MCYFTSCLLRNRIIKIKLNSPAELYLFEKKLGLGNYTATRFSNFAWLYFFSYRPLKFDNCYLQTLKTYPINWFFKLRIHSNLWLQPSPVGD